MHALAVWLLLALLCSVVAGVISRQLGMPLAWTDELAQYLLVWTGFCGWMIASRRRSHIRIGIFAARMPSAMQRVLEILTQAAIFALGLGLVWHARTLILRTLDVESISLPFPAAVLYFPLPVLGLLLMGQALAEAIVALRGRTAFSEGQVL
ncbi:MAG: TRAP transporter small permease [Beijerinckiaceae bacterium]